MKERIETRLAELQAEFEAGQRLLAELDEKRERLRESLLRIAGAIQVLEEMTGRGSRGAGGQEEGAGRDLRRKAERTEA